MTQVPAQLVAAGPPTWTDTAHLAGLPLDQLPDGAALQTRYDRKFLVERDRVAELVIGLGDHLRVLESAGTRLTTATTSYFDTSTLRTYQDHLQRRRRRFKIRTRHYGDPTSAMLELKVKGARGQTIKHRWPHPASCPERLDAAARGILTDALHAAYTQALPDGLELVAQTRFQRLTLVDPQARERITIDHDLTVTAGGRRVELGHRCVVVEVKAAHRRGPSSAAIRIMGLRPAPISKYCLGLVATHPDLRGNPWRGTLRRLAPVVGTLD